jgi:hypothetical protein
MRSQSGSANTDLKQEQVEYLWLHIMLKLLVSLIHTSPCTNVNCLCNIPKRIIYTDLKIPDICDKCKSDIAEDGWFETLPKIEASVIRYNNLLVQPFKTMTLNIEQCIDQPQSYNSAYQLKIDANFTTDWIKQNCHLNNSNDLQSFSKEMCESSFSDGLVPAWRNIILEAVGKFKDIDTLQYLTRKRHRDHTRHQVYVTAFGLFLLSGRIGGNQSIADLVLTALQKKYAGVNNADVWDTRGLRQAWTIAGLFHDSGYPLAHLLEVIANLGGSSDWGFSLDVELIRVILKHTDFYSANIKDNIPLIKTQTQIKTQNFETISESLRNSIRTMLNINSTLGCPINLSKVIETFSDQTADFDCFDHGLWSAVNLISLLHTAPGRDNYLRSPILQETVEAIALHSLALPVGKDKTTTLSFAQNPLACYLRFCDTLQEWDRGTLSSGKFHREMDSLIISPASKIDNKYYFGRNLMVQFVSSQSVSAAKSDWDLREFSKSLKNACIDDFPLQVTFETILPIKTS